MGDSELIRLMDANLNRSAEAIRVIEDQARFVLNSPCVSALAKQLRHRLRRAVEHHATAAELVMARDVSGDVGRHITTDDEHRRGTRESVLVANFKRLQESMRSMEETAKLLGWIESTTFEDLRYRSYELESQLLGGTRRRERLAARPLHVLVTGELCTHPVLDTVREVVAGGADIVQIREKNTDDREFLRLTRRALEITREGGALLVVNDNAAVARLAGADGVHVGQSDLSVPDVRRIVGYDLLVGVSAQTFDQACAALDDAPDYIGIGPVFQTDTKQCKSFLGVDQAKAFFDLAGTVPAYAIGGIDETNIDQVLELGCRCVAICSAIISRDNPRAACELFKVKLAEGQEESNSEQPTANGQ